MLAIYKVLSFVSLPFGMVHEAEIKFKCLFAERHFIVFQISFMLEIIIDCSVSKTEELFSGFSEYVGNATILDDMGTIPETK